MNVTGQYCVLDLLYSWDMQNIPGIASLSIIHQHIPFRSNPSREEPDIPDSIHRSTEDRALKQIAMRARYNQQARGHVTLSGLHVEMLRLERAALQHLPSLTYDERMEFIAGAARLRNVTARQIESYLDQAGGILMLRELNGWATSFDDLNEAETKRLYHNTSRRPVVKSRARQRPVGMAQPAIG